jgi:peptidylprolyl isomerase
MPIIALCLALALAIAGCGGGDDSTSGDTTASADAASPSEATTTEETTAEETTTEATSPQRAKPNPKLAKKPKVTVPSGPPPKQIETKELVEGSGAEAKSGDQVTVQYVGVGYKSGEEFDASWDRGEPFTFTLGGGEVISGWDEGVAGMKEGGRRELILPPEFAYGETGAPPAIGPNETLIFVVDLVAVN